MNDAEILEYIERGVRTTRARHPLAEVDWDDVEGYAGLMVATYLMDVTPVRHANCQAPAAKGTGQCGKPLIGGRARSFCSHACRLRAQRRGVKAPVANQSAGLAHRCSEADRPRYIQRALNDDLANYVVSQCKEMRPVSLDVVIDNETGTLFLNSAHPRPRSNSHYVGDAAA